MPRTACGIFVTGTDTGVGKTLVAAALLHAYAARGLRVAGMKPIAAGGRISGGVIHNEDVLALRAAGNAAVPAGLDNPYSFEPAIAPHIAAAQSNITISLDVVERAYRRLAHYADLVVVESVGGFRVPLNAHEDTADLAALLRLPVVLVVGMRLGCLNHALLTASNIEARGLALCGWVANHVDPEMSHQEENIAALAERLRSPRIARVPFQAQPDAARTAHFLELDALHWTT
jgi:dethiobiotin synthetase